jgi:hypothetical protein
MNPVVTRTLRASLPAGLMAGPAAVVLWPIALLVCGKSFDLFDYLRAVAFAVAVVAAVFGWVACVVVGWPLLVLLGVKGLNRPALVACIGGALAGAFFALVGAWPVPRRGRCMHTSRRSVRPAAPSPAGCRAHHPCIIRSRPARARATDFRFIPSPQSPRHASTRPQARQPSPSW